MLIEIPSDSEINDNIVAYWQPKDPIKAGSEFAFAYRQSWGGEPPPQPGRGDDPGDARRPLGAAGRFPDRRFVIDYQLAKQPVTASADPPTVTVTSNPGTISETTMQPNPLTGGWRLSFKLDPQDAALVELRVVVAVAGVSAETWLYRWTA